MVAVELYGMSSHIHEPMMNYFVSILSIAQGFYILHPEASSKLADNWLSVYSEEIIQQAQRKKCPEFTLVKTWLRKAQSTEQYIIFPLFCIITAISKS